MTTEKPKVKKAAKQPLIHERIAQIMAEMPAIAKDQRNQAQKYNYRSIDAVCAAAHQLLAKYGVFYTPHVVAKQRDILDRVDKNTGAIIGKTVLMAIDVEYVFFCAEDMSKLTVGPIVGEAMDTGDKASAKAMTMAEKTCLCQLFCIPVQNATDADQDNGKRETDDKAKQLANRQEPEIPAPNQFEQEILDKVADALQKDAPEGFLVDVDAVAKVCYAMKSAYPSDASKIGVIAGYFANRIVKGELCKPTEGATNEQSDSKRLFDEGAAA
jgi:hypothetical protein